jgi:virginiamycin A acetyltransferase
MLTTLKKIIKRLSKIKTAPYLIESSKNITAGKMSYHNGNFIIQGSQNVKIGSYCALGENICIITENHDYNYTVMQYTFYRHYFGKEHPGVLNYPPNKERTKGGVEIGNDVWIGHNTTILSGVKIGNGAILGNGCIVTKDVEPYSIVSGIPARKIKMRFNEETVKYLQEIEWWNWSENKIKRNVNFFNQNQNLLTVEEIESIIIQ